MHGDDQYRPDSATFVGVTLAEWWALHDNGRISVAGRMPNPWPRGRLGWIPDVPLQEPEQVVVLRIDAQRRAGDGVLLIEEVQQLIPLTERARGRLERNMRAVGVRLSAPRFEKQYLEAWYVRDRRSAVAGADALCAEVFGNAPQNVNGERKALLVALGAAIRRLDAQEAKEENQAYPLEHDTWVSSAFDFARTKPYGSPVGAYLIDAGKVLKGCGVDAEALDGLKPVIESIQARGEQSLGKQLCSDEVKKVNDELERSSPWCFPSDFRTLVLFCQWKELFHQWKEAINPEELVGLAQDLVDTGLDYDVVRNSVWVLGGFAGHSKVMPLKDTKGKDQPKLFEDTPSGRMKVTRLKVSGTPELKPKKPRQKSTRQRPTQSPPARRKRTAKRSSTGESTAVLPTSANSKQGESQSGGKSGRLPDATDHRALGSEQPTKKHATNSKTDLQADGVGSTAEDGKQNGD